MANNFKSKDVLKDVDISSLTTDIIAKFESVLSAYSSKKSDLELLNYEMNRGEVLLKLVQLMPKDLKEHVETTQSGLYPSYFKSRFRGMTLPEKNGRSYTAWLSWGARNIGSGHRTVFKEAVLAAFNGLFLTQTFSRVSSLRLRFHLGAVGSTQLRFYDSHCAKLRALMQEYASRNPRSSWFDVDRFGHKLPAAKARLPKVFNAGTLTSPTRISSIYKMPFSADPPFRSVMSILSKLTTATLKALLTDAMRSTSDRPVNRSWRKTLIEGYDQDPADFGLDVKKKKVVRYPTTVKTPPFKYNSAVLTPAIKNWLGQLILANKLLWKRPNNLYVKITGMTDRSGTDSYNSKLSMRRADAVVKYLLAQPVAGALSRKFTTGDLQAFGVGEARAERALEPDGKRNPVFRTVEIEFGTVSAR